MELHDIFKLSSIPVILVLSAVFSIIPLLPRMLPKWKRSEGRSKESAQRWQRIIDTSFSLANMLAGGFVLGTGFMHMLPDSQEYFDDWFDHDHDHDDDDHHHLGHDHDGSLMDRLSDFPWAMGIASTALLVLLFIEQMFIHGGHGGHGGHGHKKAEDHGDVEASKRGTTNLGASREEEQQLLITSPSAMAMAPDFNSDSKNPTLSAISMTLALGVHSVFEGLGFGAIETPSGTYSVLLALLAHKFLEAFALGLAVARARLRLVVALLLLLIYSCLTPAATAAGMFTQNAFDSGWSALIAGTFSSIATGSFFYIACFEMIPAELHDGRLMLPKFFFMVLGWAIMSVLALFV